MKKTLNKPRSKPPVKTYGQPECVHDQYRYRHEEGTFSMFRNMADLLHCIPNAKAGRIGFMPAGGNMWVLPPEKAKRAK